MLSLISVPPSVALSVREWDRFPSVLFIIPLYPIEFNPLVFLKGNSQGKIVVFSNSIRILYLISPSHLPPVDCNVNKIVMATTPFVTHPRITPYATTVLWLSEHCAHNQLTSYKINWKTPDSVLGKSGVYFCGDPNGTRTRATGVRGRRPNR